MNRLVRGSIMFVAAAGAWACKTNLGENGDVTDHLVATPSVVLVANTDSQSVDVEALNPQGEQLAADFAVSNVCAGIVVRQDTAFLPVPGGHSPVRARFVVRGATTTTFVSTSFTVTANGKSIDVPVTITPGNLDIAFSNPTPNAGDTVTLTAPTNVNFTSASVITASAGQATIVGISSDSTQIQVVFGPGITNATATVSDMVVAALPGQTFALTTTGRVTTPVETIAVNTLTPGIGATVSLTLSGAMRFTPGSTVSIPSAGTFISGISTDSLTMTFLIGPNANELVTVDNIVVSGAPALGTFTLATVDTVVSPVVTNFTANFSTGTPNANDLVTLSSAGFKFLPTVLIRFGNDNQTITSIAADSSSVTFRAHKPGASGTVTVANLVFSNLIQVPLTLPASAGITVGNTVTSLSGTDALATAPLVDIPPTGQTGGVIDNGPFFTGPAACSGVLGGPCKIYKVVITGARTFAVSSTWNNTTDLGIYFANSAGTLFLTGAFTGCDAHGAGAAGQPETCSITLAAAGTYFIIVDSFAPFYGPPNDVDPSFITVDLTGN